MHCSDFYSAWVQAHEASPLGKPSGDAAEKLRQHVESCEACAELARRLRIEAGLLSTLECLTAPAELDERVLAGIAVQIGEQMGPQPPVHVARCLENLSPVRAPQELDGRVEALLARMHSVPVEAGDTQAPDVLDRLVDEQLRDLPKAVVGGMLSKLERPGAPSVLDERVEAELFGPAEFFGPAESRTKAASGRAARTGGWLRTAAAASVLALLGWLVLGDSEQTGVSSDRTASVTPQANEVPEKRAYRFKVVEHDSWEDFQASAPAGLASTASQLSGIQRVGERY